MSRVDADSLDDQRSIEPKFEVDFYCYTCCNAFSTSDEFNSHTHDDEEEEENSEIRDEEDDEGSSDLYYGQNFAHCKVEDNSEEMKFEGIQINAEVDSSWYDENEESEGFQEGSTMQGNSKPNNIDSSTTFHLNINSDSSSDVGESQNPLEILEQEKEDKVTGILRRSYNKEMAACAVCGVHLRKSSLSKHMLTHGDVRAFPCELCSYAFKRRCDLLRHVRNRHKKHVIATKVPLLEQPSKTNGEENRSILTLNIASVPKNTGQNNIASRFNFHPETTITPTVVATTSINVQQQQPSKINLNQNGFNNNNRQQQPSKINLHQNGFNNNIQQSPRMQPSILKRSLVKTSSSTSSLPAPGFNNSISTAILPSPVVQNSMYQQVFTSPFVFLEQGNEKRLKRASSAVQQEIPRKRGREDIHKRNKVNDDSQSWTCCKVCGLSLHKAGLTRHLLTHSKERGHPCSICSVRFSRHFDMLRHVRTTHNISQIYKCERCEDEAFSLFRNYRQHMEEVHGEIVKKTKARVSKREILKNSDDVSDHDDTSNDYESEVTQDTPMPQIKRGRPRNYERLINFEDSFREIRPKEAPVIVATEPVMLLCTPVVNNIEIPSESERVSIKQEQDKNVIYSADELEGENVEEDLDQNSNNYDNVELSATGNIINVSQLQHSGVNLIQSTESNEHLPSNLKIDFKNCFHCSNCFKVFEALDNLKTHLTTASCKIKRSANFRNFQLNQLTQGNKSDDESDEEEIEFDFSCNKCLVDLKNLESLQNHIRTFHVVKKMTRGGQK